MSNTREQKDTSDDGESEDVYANEPLADGFQPNAKIFVAFFLIPYRDCTKRKTFFGGYRHFNLLWYSEGLETSRKLNQVKGLPYLESLQGKKLTCLPVFNLGMQMGNLPNLVTIAAL